ncbi:telomere zinc finger-associated protein isoform X4 [Ictalurus furcatus]|nr:telomere zinc finger-associated protein isoform X4 [Ictalurus furcatus]XP_053498964.1 telomere zinc finger-associated protein isoform X4 [Ictalurus furcatus]XP_053498965.1 telomere zinc finger-associated protein isoform X4 [Ictalurus furcatus]XP_053498966.1 telomere zinc finger-associated protein isoform X4 [Ictalurus furcatus]XP_053498967.1 telomere zinc finger-associated protein isoform X4 [Ictalurus furcatus]
MERRTGEGTHAQWVLSELNHQRELGKFCDVMLNTQSGQMFLAHRSILACFSQMFKDLHSSTSYTQINLPQECTVDGLEPLLHFFYTGELQLNSDNEAKVRRAANGLSVPDRFIPAQGSVCSEDVEGKPLFPSLTEDTKPDLTAIPQSASQQEAKSNGETSARPEAAVAELDESPSTSSATVTRSGRRVRGPSRLSRENAVPVDPKPSAKRKRAAALEAKDEDIILTDGEQTSYQMPIEAEDGPGDNLNDAADEDDEDSVGVFTEDTDEEYMPRDSPVTSHKGPQRKCKPKGSSGGKENGGSSSKDTHKGSVQCPTCHKTFLSKYYLKVHNRRHTGEKPFKCGKCGKCYYRKENLQEHEARNCLSRTDMMFFCSTCPMSFKRRQELRMHTVTHTGEMPNKCTSCSEQFMQKKELRNHMIKVHGAPKPHACRLCPKCFLSSTELRLHEAAKHRGEKLFVCEECGHRASSRNGLQMHIKAIHRKERPFVCEICNHAFTQKVNLNMHRRTHTGEKPYQCHLCGKTFRTQASLDKHNRTHTGERPYSCEFCEQRFTEKGPLQRHVASKHQEGQPHSCQICNKSFKAIEQLRVHVRRHKGMRNFECTECGYKFTRQCVNGWAIGPCKGVGFTSKVSPALCPETPGIGSRLPMTLCWISGSLAAALADPQPCGELQPTPEETAQPHSGGSSCSRTGPGRRSRKRGATRLWQHEGCRAGKLRHG